MKHTGTQRLFRTAETLFILILVLAVPLPASADLSGIMQLFRDTTSVDMDSVKATFIGVVTAPELSSRVDSVVEHTILYASTFDTLGSYDVDLWNNLHPDSQATFNLDYFGVATMEEYVGDTLALSVGDSLYRLTWYDSECATSPFESWLVISPDGEYKYDGFMHWIPRNSEVMPAPTLASKTAALKTWGPEVQDAYNFWDKKLGTYTWTGTIECNVVPRLIPPGQIATFQADIDVTCSYSGSGGSQAAVGLGVPTAVGNDVRNNGPYRTKLKITPELDEFINDNATNIWTLNALDNVPDVSNSGTATAGGISYTYTQSVPAGQYASFFQNSPWDVDIKVAANNVTNHGIFRGSGAYMHSAGKIIWKDASVHRLRFSSMINQTRVGKRVHYSYELSNRFATSVDVEFVCTDGTCPESNSNGYNEKKVQQVQQGHAPVGDTVAVDSVVVVGIRSDGIWVQLPQLVGSPLSGIFVETGVPPSDVHPGDFGYVVGVYEESSNFTRLRTTLGEGCIGTYDQKPIPLPPILSPCAINGMDPVSAEQWEGVLVQLDTVIVTEVDSVIGEWAVRSLTPEGGCGATDSVLITNHAASPISLPSPGDTLAALVGIVEQDGSRFVIQPRGESDVYGDGPTGIEEVDLPSRFVLKQNRPNPFNPTTDIDFLLMRSDPVTLVIYDASGRQVKTLVDEIFPPGSHTVRWDGTTDSGREVVAGVYLYRLETPHQSVTKKMILLR